MGKEVAVYLADYGMVDIVDVNHIRLDLTLEEKPVHVLQCCLYNMTHQLENRDQELDMEQVAAMREEVVEREFRVVVKGFGPPLQVMLYPMKL